MWVVFYLINIDEMLKYLLTQREKGGWWSSLIDGPGAQAALHRTTAVQSGKFMEFKEMCILSQNLHTSSCYISSNLKAMLKHRDSEHLGVTCSPQPCRGGTWLQSAQLSSATRAEHVAVLAHQGQGATHPSHIQSRACDTNTCCHNKWCLLRGISTRA